LLSGKLEFEHYQDFESSDLVNATLVNFIIFLIFFLKGSYLCMG
jgi:hypothetical protein